MDGMKKVPVREQEPKVRATNFEEVCYGYNEEEAVAEASRCLNCKNARCVQGCPVKIDIPAFVKEVKEGNYAEAAKVIGKSSALPAVCGRVCPQESQCEGQCVRGIKGEAVSIGKLERFVADWSRENGIVPEKPEKTNGIKVAVIIMFCVIPMLAWAATLWAMKGYSLTGAKMKEIQAVNRARKAAVNDGMTLEQAMDTIKTTEDAEKYQTTGGKNAAM